jgi:curli biogenesis system outer membrane secretion channel CsgG
MNPKNLIILLIALMTVAPLAWAQDETAASGENATAPKPNQPITVAVLSFSALDTAEASTGQAPNEGMGAEISEALVALLSGEPGFSMVDRSAMNQTLAEQELTLTGLVNTDQAVQVGRLVGAKILVTGRAFQLGEKVFITTKLIGTETSLVEGVLVRGEIDADLGDLLMELGAKVAEKLNTAGPKLIASPATSLDPLPRLKQQLAGIDLPTVAVLIRETHHAAPRPTVPTAVLDPAVETEVKRVLALCGVTLRDVPGNELAEFADEWEANGRRAWPRGLTGVDIMITGEAFSEFASRIGNLVSCAARAEVNVIGRETGEIVYAERATVRAVDLSENIAGKTALQKAGLKIAVGILEHLIQKNQPPAKAEPTQ